MYNKETHQLTYKIPPDQNPSEARAVLAQSIAGISKTKYLLYRSTKYFSLVDLTKKTMTPFLKFKHVDITDSK